MQKLYKQFAGWVTKYKPKFSGRMDEFFKARIRLSLYYFLTAVIILGISSIITYNAILYNFSQSILEKGFDPDISEAIILDAKGILLNRFVTVDSIIILFTVLIGFILTVKTLKPIKEYTERQKRFIANASHELRTPTAVMISGLEVALNNKKLDFNSAKKTLESTLDELREFSKLSSSLLDMSKYYTNKVEIKHETMNINELVRSIAEKSKNLALAKEIDFQIAITEKPVIIKGNDVELSRVFYNVFDNAIKYTSPGGTISISDKVNYNNYTTNIIDNGVGISKNIINRIFEPFFRGETARNIDGAGLGLTLVKRIIENHRGAIFVKSEENKGTNVTITLPITS